MAHKGISSLSYSCSPTTSSLLASPAMSTELQKRSAMSTELQKRSRLHRSRSQSHTSRRRSPHDTWQELHTSLDRQDSNKRSLLRQLAEDAMLVATNGIVSDVCTDVAVMQKVSNSVTSRPVASTNQNSAQLEFTPNVSPFRERRSTFGFRITPKGSPMILKKGGSTYQSPRLNLRWSSQRSPRSRSPRSRSPRSSPSAGKPQKASTSTGKVVCRLHIYIFFIVSPYQFGIQSFKLIFSLSYVIQNGIIL